MNITIINTGGTFNKRYNPIKGALEVPTDSVALNQIIKDCHNINFDVQNVVSKDSLEMDDNDRAIIANAVKNSKNEHVIIIHGTDTVDLTSSFLHKYGIEKKVVFTAAMIPMSISISEATMNFSLALGFLSAPINNGIYLAMHGVVVDHSRLVKNRKEGKFLIQ